MQLVTFGEGLLRLSPTNGEPIERARAFDAHVGGSELNVAVAAACLGVASRWVSRLPDNALGRLVAGRAREHGVDTRVEWTADGRVGLYFLERGSAPRETTVLYDRAGSAISMVAPGMIDWTSALRGARWFHVSGITPALSESAAAATAEALQVARDAGLTVSYDVNFRGKLWSPERARDVQLPLLKFVDLLITTEEDARTLFGTGAGGEGGRHAAVALLERFGIGAVAVTVRDPVDGSGGILALKVGGVHSAPRHRVDVVDRVGAGDAFVAGLIAGRLEGRDWEDALQLAAALGAHKLTIHGDFCVTTRAAVEQMMRREHSSATR